MVDIKISYKCISETSYHINMSLNSYPMWISLADPNSISQLPKKTWKYLTLAFISNKCTVSIRQHQIILVYFVSVTPTTAKAIWQNTFLGSSSRGAYNSRPTRGPLSFLHFRKYAALPNEIFLRFARFCEP